MPTPPLPSLDGGTMPNVDQSASTPAHAEHIAEDGRGWHRPLLGFAIAIVAVVAAIWWLIASRGPGDWAIPIIEGKPRDVIAEIRRTPRSVVYLDTRWSHYTVSGR